VTLDPDAERLLRKAIAERGHSFKRVLNDAIRRGLGKSRSGKPSPIIVRTFRSPYAPGVDRHRLQQLSDAIETEEVLARQGDRSS